MKIRKLRLAIVIALFLSAAVQLAASARAMAANLFVSVNGGSSGTGGSGGNTILEISPSGTQTPYASVAGPLGLAFDSKGNLFVSNDSVGSLVELPPGNPGGGSGTVAYGPGIFYCYGLAIDSSNDVYMANEGSTITKYTPPVAPATAFAQSVFAGSSAGLQNPFGLAIGPNGNLYVGDQGTKSVYELSPTGSFVATVASGFMNPFGLAFDSSGDLFVSDFGTGDISKITPGGTETTFVSGLSKPFGLAVDSSGNLYEANFASSGTINEYSPTGNFMATVATGLDYPAFLTFGPVVPEPSTWLLATLGAGGLWLARRRGGRAAQGLSLLLLISPLMASSTAKAANLYVSTVGGGTGAGTINQFTPSGTESIFASGLFGPIGLAFDTNSNMYDADHLEGKINKFTPAGTQSTFAIGLSLPAGLAFDANGNLFVADIAAGNIYEFTATGVRSTFASGLGSPYGLAFDSSGNLFEGDDSGNVYKFTPAGSKSLFASGLGDTSQLAFDSGGDLFVASIFGGNIYEYTSAGVQSTFASGLSQPIGLAFDASGDLFVADSNNGMSEFNSGIIYEYTPNGSRSTFATGLNEPVFLAFYPVPEPATWLLATLGAGCLWFARRRGC